MAPGSTAAQDSTQAVPDDTRRQPNGTREHQVLPGDSRQPKAIQDWLLVMARYAPSLEITLFSPFQEKPISSSTSLILEMPLFSPYPRDAAVLTPILEMPHFSTYRWDDSDPLIVLSI